MDTYIYIYTLKDGVYCQIYDCQIIIQLANVNIGLISAIVSCTFAFQNWLETWTN